MAETRNVFVEFHALTSHVPSNLNRDELGTPKTALFGGARRLRISSQCLKRTWRVSEHFRGEFAEEQLGIRTNRLPEIVQDELGKEVPEPVKEGLVALLKSIGTGDSKIKSEEEDDGEGEAQEEAGTPDAVTAEVHTKHLLFLSRQEIEAVMGFAREHRQELADLFDDKPAKGKATKKALSKPKLEKVRKAFAAHMVERCRRNAVDVALFGRFVTSDDIPTIDAAMQVAHALGTQKVEVEYDYFSAVDDLATGPGAAHIGESEFASSVFYKYAVCDMKQLHQSLDGDSALAARAMKAIALAVARAVPIGKKNSTAPQNPADYLEVVVRRDAPVSLANAFLKPVVPTRDGDVMDESIRHLRAQAARYDAAYGADVLGRFVLSLRNVQLGASVTACATLGELAAKVDELVGKLGEELAPAKRA